MNSPPAIESYYKHQRLFDIMDQLTVRPWHWIVLTITILCADLISGPRIQFPILLLIPIFLVSLYGSMSYSLSFVVLMSSSRLLFNQIWGLPSLSFDAIINFVIRTILFLGIVFLIRLVKDLRLLYGILHVCSYCGHVKESEESWVPLQLYITRHSEAVLSHGVCPQCKPELMRAFLGKKIGEGH